MVGWCNQISIHIKVCGGHRGLVVKFVNQVGIIHILLWLSWLERLWSVWQLICAK